MRHGTTYAYGIHRCRCDRCRAANAVKSRLQRAREPAAVRENRLARGRVRNREWKNNLPLDMHEERIRKDGERRRRNQAAKRNQISSAMWRAIADIASKATKKREKRK